MKSKKLIRALCALLTVSMMLTGPALAAAMGDELDSYTTEVRGETDLSRGVYWTGSDYRCENYMEYTPNDSVFPVVVYGSKLLNHGDFLSMAKLLNQEGYYVVGGINGDYYNTWDYQPIGVVIKDGELISTDGGFFAVGFKADGSAVLGKPGIVVKASFSGETYQLSNVNKARQTGYNLYTSKYASATKNTTPGWNVILSAPEDAKLTVDCTLDLTVEEIFESDGAVTIPEGKYVLSLPDTADEWRQKGIKGLTAGDTVELTVTSNEGWDEVLWSVGSLYQLIGDGKINADLPNETASRTAVGQKEDGTVVFYTIDGRSPGYSVGATMTQVAERLLELGCTNALLMDGGGSTTMNVVLPGYSAISQINIPSDGKQRSVTEYIMLVSTTPPSETPARLVLYPRSSQMLVGAQLELNLKATDAVGFAADVPESHSYAVENSLGSFEGDVFTAEKAGEGEISVSAADMTDGTAQVTIVETPDTITVKNGETGAACASLALKTEASTDLTAAANYNHLPLTVRDECFTWAVTGDIGTIDANGVFTASETPGEGTVEVTAGENTVSIPVKISYPAGIYSDVAENAWYYDAVKAMGEQGYITGVTETEYAPDANMTRAMLVTLLYRIENQPDVSGDMPFTDVESDKWYSNAVLWAGKQGLVNGYDEETFGINDSISREQMATLLMRYAKWKGEDVTSDESLGRFTDKGEISAYAVDAVKWAVGKTLIKGMTETSFVPKGTASRAQVAVLLDRYLAG
ncbi:MAG: phosphodiester glycosidase family protein [Oscillospiraceae bacterium]